MSVGQNGTDRGEPCHEWADAIRDTACGITEGGEGLKAHLAICPRCRLREAELRGVAASLCELGHSGVEPAADFHARWVEAVIGKRSANRADANFASLEAWRSFIRAQLRPALALLPVWVLILLFWISTPEPAGTRSVPVAESPFRILQAFIAQHEFSSPLEMTDSE